MTKKEIDKREDGYTFLGRCRDGKYRIFIDGYVFTVPEHTARLWERAEIMLAILKELINPCEYGCPKCRPKKAPWDNCEDCTAGVNEEMAEKINKLIAEIEGDNNGAA